MRNVLKAFYILILLIALGRIGPELIQAITETAGQGADLWHEYALPPKWDIAVIQITVATICVYFVLKD